MLEASNYTLHDEQVIKVAAGLAAAWKPSRADA